MKRKLINKDDFEGKTITSLDCSAVNCIRFLFSDGSEVELEAQALLPSIGLHGIVQTTWFEGQNLDKD